MGALASVRLGICFGNSWYTDLIPSLAFLPCVPLAPSLWVPAQPPQLHEPSIMRVDYTDLKQKRRAKFGGKQSIQAAVWTISSVIGVAPTEQKELREGEPSPSPGLKPDMRPPEL